MSTTFYVRFLPFQLDRTVGKIIVVDFTDRLHSYNNRKINNINNKKGLRITRNLRILLEGLQKPYKYSRRGGVLGLRDDRYVRPDPSTDTCEYQQPILEYILEYTHTHTHTHTHTS